MSDDRQSSDVQPSCSFCGKAQHEVRKLIAGPTVFICDECVDLCNDVIEEDAGTPHDEGRAPESAHRTDRALRAVVGCSLCRLPKEWPQLRSVGLRGPLCEDCIDAVVRHVGKDIHHIDLTVSDLTLSTEFYDRILPLFGFRRVPDTDGNPVWAGAFSEIGLQPARIESLRPHDRYSSGLHHLAFAAPTQNAVNEVFRDLERLGVVILDPPARYDQYATGYYAVFFADPDGIKLEYVFTPEWPV